MLGRFWIVLVLFCATTAVAQSNPEIEKLRADAQKAYEETEYQKAKDLTNRILAVNPKDHAAMYLRASARVELGVLNRDLKEIREGIEDSRESLKIAGSGEYNYYLPYLFGMISLANIEDKKEHANVALEVAKTVLNKSSLTPEQRANVLYQRASAHMYLKDVNAAIDDYQAAIKGFPLHMGSYMGLAQSYIISGQPDKALATFTAAVEAMPTKAIVYNNRGLFLQQQGKSKESLADFTKAIEIDPKFATAYANRGFAYQSLGNLPEAEADYSKAITLAPMIPLFASLRGTCRLSQQNIPGAIEDYTTAIRLNPENAVVHADLGFAEFFSRDYAGAAAAFEQSIKTEPNAMRYLNPWRVWSLVLAGKPEGISDIAAASKNKPEKEQDWIDQQVLFLKGDISERAFVEFVSKTTDAKMKNAQLSEAYFFIGERRFHANDKANAVQFYQRVLDMKETHLSAYRGAQFAMQAIGK